MLFIKYVIYNTDYSLQKELKNSSLKIVKFYYNFLTFLKLEKEELNNFMESKSEGSLYFPYFPDNLVIFHGILFVFSTFFHGIRAIYTILFLANPTIPKRWKIINSQNIYKNVIYHKQIETKFKKIFINDKFKFLIFNIKINQNKH